MKRSIVILALSVSLLWSVGSTVQEPAAARECQRFETVKKWKGTFTIEFQYSASRYHEPDNSFFTIFSARMNHSASGSFELERESVAPFWSGYGTAKVNIDDEAIHGPPDPGWKFVASSRGSGDTALTGGFRLGIDPRGCTYKLRLGDMALRVEETVSRTVEGKTRVEKRQEVQKIRVRINEIPLPERGLAIHDSRLVPLHGTENVFLTLGSTGAGGVHAYDTKNPPKAILTWNLVPADMKEYLLEVELEGYDQWEPQASADQVTPGNDITAVARLRTPDGTVLDQKAKQIIFELFDVSSVPGVAMNYPPSTTASHDPDLRFHQDRNFKYVNVVDTKGQRAETPPNSEVTETRAAISSHDWGAFGKLRVTAVMSDGTRIAGHLKADRHRTEILIPKREENSKIADHAKQRAGVATLADDDDSDNDPVGDGYKGDGFTLYEEYRGFYVNGQHIRTNPKKKNLFVYSKIGRPSEEGILRFQTATGVQVYYKLVAAEIGNARVMNFNHGRQVPHLGDQHGLLMQTGACLFAAPNTSASCAIGGPGTPRQVSEIRIGNPFNDTEYSNTVAHELAHAVNVRHHGGTDVPAQRWLVDRTTNPARLTENGTSITVRREDGTLVNPANPNVQSLTVWLGGEHGQHSGEQFCLMRWTQSQAYRSKASAGTRYWINRQDETRGPFLCESKEGTGINSADRRPQPRYGNADLGNCKAQVRVRDF